MDNNYEDRVVPGTSGLGNSSTNESWETFQDIQPNSQGSQLRTTRKRKATETCPLCGIEAAAENIVSHIIICLQTSSHYSDSDVFNFEEYEEYEWARQPRARRARVLQENVPGLSTTYSAAEHNEEVVPVDLDDITMYGSPQYSETDVILQCTNSENAALTEAIASSNPEPLCVKEDPSAEISGVNPIIQILQIRLKELETKYKSAGEIYNCSICIESYKTPATSIRCWHVFCEQCWLKTLKVKKSCPHCNKATLPTDLRKIYM